MVEKFRKIFFVFAIVAISLMGMPVHTAKAATVSAGSLIKASGAAVYYYASNGKRFVFPNEKTYKTWFNDFSSVVTITDAELAAIQIGGNIVYRPGTRLVKITTDPKVYAVSAHGTLHWITSETLANQLYGATWNQMIDDVSDAFFTNYTYGADITSAVHPDGAQIKYAGSSNIYVIEGGNKRLIADAAAYSANRFNSAFVMNIADTITYTSAATSLSVAETLYTDVAQLGGSTPIVTGNLNVTVASDTPASVTIPMGAVGVPVAKFTLTAGSNAVTVDSLTVKRTGLGNVNEIDRVYLYNGDAKLTSGRSLNATTHTATFTNLALTVPANGSVTLTVKVDVSTAFGGGTHRFGIEGVGDITSSASVGGIFPVRANEFAISSTVMTGQVDIESNGADYTRKVGETGVEVANFTVYVSNDENGKVHSVTLYNADRDILSNLKLYRGSSLVATGTQSGNYFIFNLSTPFEIAKGDSAQFTVKGDVGGRKDDFATLSIRYKADVNVVGMTYGYPLTVIDDGDTDSYIEDIANGILQSNTTTAEAGQITVAANGPVTTDVAKDSDKVVLMNFAITAASAADVEKATILIDDNGSLTLDATEVENLELVCNNVVVAQWSTVMLGNNVSTDNWTIPTGGVNCVVRVDITNTADDGDEVRAILVDMKGADWTFKDAVTGDTLTDIIPDGDINGNSMLVTEASLNINLATSPADANIYVKNSTEVAVNGFVFTAGNAADVKVTSVKVTAGAADDGNISDALFTEVDETSGAEDIISVVRIYADNGGTLTQLGTAKTLTVGTADISATFTDLNWTIPAGASQKLVVKADISSNAPFSATNDEIAFDIVAGGDVIAEYGNGKNLGATIVTDNGFGTGVATIGQTVTDAGVLTMTVDADTPVSSLLIAGNTHNVTKVKFAATKENIRVEKLRVSNLGGSQSNYASATLTYTDIGGNTQTKTVFFIGNDADFSGLAIHVPKDGNTIVTIKANLNTVEGGTVNAGLVRLGVDNVANFRAITLSSNTLYSNVAAAAQGESHYAVDSYPSFAYDKVAVPDNNNATYADGMKVAEIKVTAYGNKDVTFDGDAVGGQAISPDNFINVDFITNSGIANLGNFVWITDGTSTLCDNLGDVVVDNVFTCAFNLKDLVVAPNTTKVLSVYIDASTALLGSGHTLQSKLVEGAANLEYSIDFNNGNYNTLGAIIFRGTLTGANFFQE